MYTAVYYLYKDKQWYLVASKHDICDDAYWVKNWTWKTRKEAQEKVDDWNATTNVAYYEVIELWPSTL